MSTRRFHKPNRITYPDFVATISCTNLSSVIDTGSDTGPDPGPPYEQPFTDFIFPITDVVGDGGLTSGSLPTSIGFFGAYFPQAWPVSGALDALSAMSISGTYKFTASFSDQAAIPLTYGCYEVISGIPVITRQPSTYLVSSSQNLLYDELVSLGFGNYTTTPFNIAFTANLDLNFLPAFDPSYNMVTRPPISIVNSGKFTLLTAGHFELNYPTASDPITYRPSYVVSYSGSVTYGIVFAP